ncbi:hypothetical protein JVU11DRAFT_8339 [Chiua virens]|nr:hypothetical protein JVU11DRAFT_8339 [Chiua virens]
MAELIPLTAVSTQLQDQIADGNALRDTDAGRIINKDTEDLMEKHTKELVDMKNDMAQAERDRDEALRAQLDAEQKGLEEQIRRAEEDLARQQVMEVKAWFDKRITKLQQDRAQAQENARKWRGQLDRARKRLLEISKSQQNRAQTQEDPGQSRAQFAGKQQGRGAATITIRKWQEDAALRRQRELEQRATEAEQNAAMLQQKIERIEAEKRKADDYANRGVFTRFFHGISSIISWRSEEENRVT